MGGAYRECSQDGGEAGRISVQSQEKPYGEASQKRGWGAEQAWFPPEVRVIGTVGRGQQLTASWGLGPPGPK